MEAVTIISIAMVVATATLAMASFRNYYIMKLSRTSKEAKIASEIEMQNYNQSSQVRVVKANATEKALRELLKSATQKMSAASKAQTVQTKKQLVQQAQQLRKEKEEQNRKAKQQEKALRQKTQEALDNLYKSSEGFF